jgi:DNA-3-methyladenine glycosylase II
MKLPLPVTQPFSFAQTLAFVRRFPPCQGQYVVTSDSLTAAVTVGGRATAFTIRDGSVEFDRAADGPALLARAAHLVGANDDLTTFYERAVSDRPFQPLLMMLHGLHHVRFLTLEEVAIYSVLTQRTPIAMAARMKQKLFAKLGRPVEVAGETLHALPSLTDLACLDGAAYTDAIGHARKGPIIAEVVRGVARIGETFLREAPYEAAKRELLAIRGIGPFSAAMILLRGLGRMDEVPLAQTFEEEARVLYGKAYDEAAIRKRYGKTLGYWSFYLKTGVARLVRTERSPTMCAEGAQRRNSEARDGRNMISRG